MTDVINLNKFKKAKKKQEKAKKAQQNRIVHGRSGAQKAVARAEAERAQVQLGQQRLEQGSAIKTVDDSE